MRTKTEIQVKWDKKLNDMIKSANYRFRNQFSKKAVKMETDCISAAVRLRTCSVSLPKIPEWKCWR